MTQPRGEPPIDVSSLSSRTNNKEGEKTCGIYFLKFGFGY